MNVYSQRFFRHSNILSYQILSEQVDKFIISHKKSGDNSLKHKNKKLIFPLHSFLFFFAVTVFSPKGIGALTVLSALIHELGHIFAAKICSVGIERVTVYPFGADIRLRPSLRSYKTDLIIALSGPICNLILAYVGKSLSFSDTFIICNLILASVNLLPIQGLDGGTALSAMLHLVFSEDICQTVLRKASFLCLFVIWMLSVFLLLSENGDPSLFIIVCALFASIFLKK